MDKLVAALKAEVEMLRIRVHLKDERIAELERENSQVNHELEECARRGTDKNKRIAELEGVLWAARLTLQSRVAPGRRIDAAVQKIRLAKLEAP